MGLPIIFPRVVLDFINIDKTIQQISSLLENDFFSKQIKEFSLQLNKAITSCENKIVDTEANSMKGDLIPHCPKCNETFDFNADMIQHYRSEHNGCKRTDRETLENQNQSDMTDDLKNHQHEENDGNGKNTKERYERSVAIIKFKGNLEVKHDEPSNAISKYSDEGKSPVSQNVRKNVEENLVDLKQQLVSDEPKNKLQLQCPECGDKHIENNCHKEKMKLKQPSNANCNYTAEGESSVGHNVDEASLDPDLKQCELPLHEQLQCPKCGDVYKQHAALQKHIENNCNQEKKLKQTCPECGKAFQCDFHLKRHLSVHNSYICEDCGKMFHHETLLKRHSCRGLDWTCEHCGKIFNKKRAMINHQTIHNDEWFLCGECDYKTQHRGNLSHHNSVKHRGKKYFCPKCDYHSEHKQRLDHHLDVIHSGEKHSCEHCPYKGSAVALYQHKRIKHKA